MALTHQIKWPNKVLPKTHIYLGLVVMRERLICLIISRMEIMDKLSTYLCLVTNKTKGL